MRDKVHFPTELLRNWFLSAEPILLPLEATMKTNMSKTEAQKYNVMNSESLKTPFVPMCISWLCAPHSRGLRFKRPIAQVLVAAEREHIELVFL